MDKGANLSFINDSSKSDFNGDKLNYVVTMSFKRIRKFNRILNFPIVNQQFAFQVSSYEEQCIIMAITVLKPWDFYSKGSLNCSRKYLKMAAIFMVLLLYLLNILIGLKQSFLQETTMLLLLECLIDHLQILLQGYSKFFSLIFFGNRSLLRKSNANAQTANIIYY